MSKLILHEYAQSGNCYKIRLTAAHVGVAIERRDYDIMAGATRSPAFLASVNPNGRIPVLQIGDDFLPESGAACLYLADGSPKRSPTECHQRRWPFRSPVEPAQEGPATVAA